MQIRRLALTNFRGFDTFEWHPRPGVNCLIGPGDSGKTTILEAIARATSPAPAGPADEHDYFRRRTESGFVIELVLGALPTEILGSFSVAPCWGWRGPDQQMLPAPVDGAEPVLKLVVRGTPDLEVEHRLLAPNDEELPFGSEKRRRLGLCRIGEMRGSSREFRMARGSLLERTLGREDVRGIAARAVRDASEELQLPEGISTRLTELGGKLAAEGIGEGNAALEVLAPPGQSLLSLLGLALSLRDGAMALAWAGNGTQRIASYILATALAEAPALVVMDEVEFGLEPYRQRLLMARLRELLRTDGQAFLTTHAPAVLDELEITELHRVARPTVEPEVHDLRRGASETPRAITPASVVTALSGPITRVKADDPEALLCALPVVCEGQTEVTLLAAALDARASAAGTRMGALGIHLVDGQGQPHAFKVIEALRAAGFRVAAFLDTEQNHHGRRKNLVDSGVICAGFSSGTCTEMALAMTLPAALLDELVEVAPADAGRLGDARRQQLAHRLGRDGNTDPSVLARDLEGSDLRLAFGQAAHECGWFKSRHTSVALAEWLAAGRMPMDMAADVDRFWRRLLSVLNPGPQLEHDHASS